MKPSAFLSCASAAALAGAMIATPAMAQDAQPAAAPADDAADVAPIVVTAAASGKSARLSSISVSQINQDAVIAFTPRSQAEVLRTIPGLNVQDTAGPGGNANIGVRGIPVSTGGSEYVGLQEDGLPVTLFGDIHVRQQRLLGALRQQCEPRGSGARRFGLDLLEPGAGRGDQLCVQDRRA
jgi:outer membrane receptor for Fe3+-dicitrate